MMATKQIMLIDTSYPSLQEDKHSAMYNQSPLGLQYYKIPLGWFPKVDRE